MRDIVVITAKHQRAIHHQKIRSYTEAKNGFATVSVDSLK